MAVPPGPGPYGSEPPQHTGFPPPARRRGPILVVAVVGAALAVMLVVVAALVLIRACGGGEENAASVRFPGMQEMRACGGEEEDPAPVQGSGALASPVRFLRVQEQYPLQGTCRNGDMLALDGVTCYRLGDGMTVTRLKRIAAVHPTAELPDWRVQFSLEPADARAFGDLTRELADAAHTTAPLLAIVADGRVISAPQVMSAITGGEVEITVKSRAQAEELVRRILGAG
ncbi:SecDF P1 head subdomain-containing protein [Thermomonospora amylolytica]|uniref:SecDF P1 head subdomain-containing protein n=1 Tax=Thermomonospora amylolytica TaxID=1411117 RepID=UPI0013007A72|nr:hypothetical protein [Thermomonospora amylolytica]